MLDLLSPVPFNVGLELGTEKPFKDNTGRKTGIRTV